MLKRSQPYFLRHFYTSRRSSQSGFLTSAFVQQTDTGVDNLSDPGSKRKKAPLLRKDTICQSIQDLVKDIHVPGFELISVNPRIKDGGVFIEFYYISDSEATTASNSTLVDDPALTKIQSTMLEKINSQGGLPSSIPFKTGHIWRVIGYPWKEDMRRYASRTLRVEFDGPDIREERLWDFLRPFGRIEYINPPVPVPAGMLRSSHVTFQRISSATVAHNCIHGISIPSPSNPQVSTRLNTSYERPIKAHVIRDWLTSHPRIVFPVLVFLIGSLTYTVFDPIRAFAVESKLLGWFDYRKNVVVQWFMRQSLFKLLEPPKAESRHLNASAWKDRKDAEESLQSYLSDEPTTLTFVHGPAGSGKTMLLDSVLEKTPRHLVIIDCSKIYDATSDAGMVKSLARQTGYRPIFTFLDSFKNVIDIASVGLIGQKAGLSSSLQDQVKEVLDVVEQGLRRATIYVERESKRGEENEKLKEKRNQWQAERIAKIKSGHFHDGRIDCVAGNGIMSELGVGIERFDDESERSLPDNEHQLKQEQPPSITAERKEYKSVRSIEAIPVIVIKHYDANCQGTKSLITTALANWAGRLASGKIAHVIVTSDDRDATKLSKAIPTRPLNDIILSDADETSALSYLQQNLKDLGLEHKFNSQDVRLLQRLGGRVRDLETVIHKLSTYPNVTISEVMEDIERRGVTEVRKNVFAGESEEGTNLAWTKQQAWSIVKALAQKDHVNYYDVLMNFPFKGNEEALRALEQIELISIITSNGKWKPLV
ncbi:hypothetical protein Clacol_006724 [Clathrus columnatus]|uniref:Mitochondrial escape protein 2 n=1 Tax=Clathrus columnatus TaxID=1419009 RepID=A0AAV5ACV5_9AGAM|nr:hypothetical protein Clacol_006724 [Clathrus columnatus]